VPYVGWFHLTATINKHAIDRGHQKLRSDFGYIRPDWNADRLAALRLPGEEVESIAKDSGRIVLEVALCGILSV
jgi:hypothetical protein